MKTILAALTVAAVALPSFAFAATYYDPNENEFVQLPETTNPANAEAAAADAARYTNTLTYWDSAEGEFTTVKVGGPEASDSAVATHSPERAMKRVWDPAEGEFMMVPAN